MSNDAPEPMTPFDELVTSPELQMMKLLIPYAPAPGRRILAAFVKFTELKKTLRLFRRPGAFRAQAFEAESSFPEILDSFRPYLSAQQAAALDQISALREMMDVIGMMQSMQDAPRGQEDPGGTPGNPFPADPMEILSMMLSPEQQEMFRAYSGLFDQKGDDGNERMDGPSGDEGYGSREAGADPDGGGEDFRQDREGSGPGHAGPDHRREQERDPFYPRRGFSDPGDPQTGEEQGRTGTDPAHGGDDPLHVREVQ